MIFRSLKEFPGLFKRINKLLEKIKSANGPISGPQAGVPWDSGPPHIAA
jgi:hypothetical protein